LASQDILIVDDEVGIRELLSEILQDEGYGIVLAENAEAARKIRNQSQPRLVLLDIWMPDTDGITLLKEWSRNGQLTMPVVMMSGHATIDTAVEATRIGALDFLEKPIGLQKLLATVKRALSLPSETAVRAPTLERLGAGTAIQELQSTLSPLRGRPGPVLLLGLPGVGFEHCARFLNMPNAPFVSPPSNEDLAQAPQELLNKATGGILFLRDLAWLDRRAQLGLKSVLPKLEKQRVRLVCASSKPLSVLAGQLEPELLNYISQLSIAIPSLSEHREDIPLLAEKLLADAISVHKLGPRYFSPLALQLLSRQVWAGNLDELANVVKSVAITSRDGEIDSAPLARLLSQFAPNGSISNESHSQHASGLPNIDLSLPLREARDQFEKLYIERQIDLSNGNMSRVAEKVGLERTHLYRKLKQLGIAVPKKQRSTEEE
jgi:two-component system, NtrC family, nitrogen regulation response regulator NtrX